MKTRLLIALLLLILPAASCGAARVTPSVTDSTRVEVRTHIVRQIDTAFIELPVIVEKVTTLDTSSVLENKYAKSEAIVSGGVLHHSLATKPVRQPVAVEKEIVYKDSLVFRDRVSTETVEIEKQLNWWQRLRLFLGTLVLIAALAAIAYFIIKLFVPLNIFKS